MSSTVFLLATPARAQDPGAPDVVYYNGKVVTVNDAFSIAEAVAISGGRIVAVGSDEDILSVDPGRIRDIPVELTIIDGREVFSGSHVEPYFQEPPRSR